MLSAASSLASGPWLRPALLEAPFAQEGSGRGSRRGRARFSSVGGVARCEAMVGGAVRAVDWRHHQAAGLSPSTVSGAEPPRPGARAGGGNASRRRLLYPSR
eukprot:GHVT01088982.1.p2 GENE.GHVT01088982.1~~GHVT01088982.1.p2  ORF type:complete len:102 (-),score=16.62 GHVT01088982.1:781-1086(-)